MKFLFTIFDLHLHPTKTTFDGITQLKILGTLVYTDRCDFLLCAAKLPAISPAARHICRYVSTHQSRIPPNRNRGFIGLAKYVSAAVVEARLRLRKLFNAFQPVVTPRYPHSPYEYLAPFLTPSPPTDFSNFHILQFVTWVGGRRFPPTSMLGAVFGQAIPRN